MQTIGITGGTGFVGHHLTQLLLDNGFRVIIFTRDMHKVSRVKNVKYSFWSPDEQKFDLTWLKQLNAVIHLAGAGVADKRWTKARKEEIVNSRVKGTHFLIQRLKEHAPNCKVFIAASAIGYYGNDRMNSKPFEENASAASDFLGTTSMKWEAESIKAKEFARTVILRFGIILGKNDGAFPKFEQPQRFGLMPILSNGKQILSWIHIDDLCQIILTALKKETMQGVYNAVAPKPVSNKELMKTISKVKGGIKIPFHVPAFSLEMILGEMATEVLKSCTVSADKIQQTGFSFKYPEIETAVEDILK